MNPFAGGSIPIMSFPFGRNAITVKSCAAEPLEKYQAPTIGEAASVSRGKSKLPSEGALSVRAVLLPDAVVPGGSPGRHVVDPDGELQNPHSPFVLITVLIENAPVIEFQV